MSRLCTLAFCVTVFAGSGCKSSFEKMRTSGDPVAILQAADQYYDAKDFNRARGLYEIVLTAFRGQPEAEEIYFRYANAHFALREYDLSNYLFKNFANTFSNSLKKEEAEFLSVLSFYKMAPGYRLDQSSTIKAIDGFQLFINTYPNSDRVAECNQLIDACRSKLEQKAFESARLYYDMEHYQSCVRSLQNLLADFPETPNDREVRLLMSRAAFQLAERSIFEKQKERYEEAAAIAEEFLKRYPTGKQRSEVKTILQKIQRKLKSTNYDGYQNASAGN
ncbi:MAG: outer membrane protein assembly factor BamD [Saprospiraceae bacterium]|nr:outer membrane protein assembly factor BamD [Saprospiraceae bacterium]